MPTPRFPRWLRWILLGAVALFVVGALVLGILVYVVSSRLPDVQTLRDTELQRATDLWRKRFGTPPADLKEKAKQLRFMAARGFSSAVVSRVLRDAPYSSFDENEDHN